jgi:hypothetical protein
LTITARAGATMNAAPTPCTARPAMSQPAPGAMAHSNDAQVKTAAPNMSVRRRPNWSATRPATTTKASTARKKEDTIHAPSVTGAFRSRSSVGRATLTATVSRADRPTVAEVATSVQSAFRSTALRARRRAMPRGATVLSADRMEGKGPTLGNP